MLATDNTTNDKRCITHRDLLKAGQQVLQKAGLSNPRREVECLLMHALGIGRLALYLRLDQSVPETGRNAAAALFEQRARRIPLQHLTGIEEFWGLAFEVSPDVLIPRPETEHLVEAALNWTASQKTPIDRVLDLGTGSGCIAVALAKSLPRIQVIASDLSLPALQVAKRNAVRLAVARRISFVQGDLFEPFRRDLGINLIVSNPPYIPAAEIPGLEPEVGHHEPRLALDGGPDGLDLIRRILSEAEPYLKANGALILEVGYDQAGRISRWVREAGLSWSFEFAKDLSGIPRIGIFTRQGPANG